MKNFGSDGVTLAMIAGGLVVMKSNSSPRIPIPSLSKRNKGKLAVGLVMGVSKASPRMVAHSTDGKTVETSAPVVVVPIEPLPVWKKKTNLEYK